MSVNHDTIGGYLGEHNPVGELWNRLAEIVGGHAEGEDPVAGMTLPAATIYLVAVFEGQVGRGGFHNFLRSRSGDHALDTVQALREVGAHVSAELLEKAMALLPEGPAATSHVDRVRGIDQAELANPDLFAPLDEHFAQAVDPLNPRRVEKIIDLLRDYMDEHAAVRPTY